MSESVRLLKEMFEAFSVDYDAFTVKGNKTAGRRARKTLLEMGKLTKTIRAEIQEMRNNAQ